MHKALAYLEQIRAETGVRVTVTHLVARGVALAIRRYPTLNGIVARGRIYLRATVDLFLQVAIDGGADLSGIKIDRVDEKSAIEIAGEVEVRVERLRQRRDRQVERTKSMLDRIPLLLLGPIMRAISYLIYDLDLDLSRLGVVKDEFGSGMITNVGTFGIDFAFAPLLPLGRCAMLLLMSEVKPRPLVVNGKLEVRDTLRLCGTFDHRIVDGYQAGVIARELRASIEQPETAFGKIVTSSKGAVAPS